MSPEAKIQTFSIIAGSRACNARCQFCISKMTPDQEMTIKPEEINWDRFRRAYEYARDGRAETAMITGKGEPTLFPDHISEYLNGLLKNERKMGYKIPRRELQTNGIEIAQGNVDDLLYLWRAGKLHMVAISIVHYEPEANRQVYTPYKESYLDLPKLIDKLHQTDFSVRLTCVLLKGFIDNSKKLEQLIRFAKDNHVEQLTIRPVNKPASWENEEVAKYIEEHKLTNDQLRDLEEFLEEHGTVMQIFPFGGAIYSVYDIGDQNVCLTNSLTKSVGTNYLRQLIFYPRGRIATDWTEKGENLP